MAAEDHLSERQFDPSAINRVQHVPTKWIMENMQPTDDPDWARTRQYVHASLKGRPEFVEGFRKSIREKGVRRAITASGNYVLNGHHRVIVAHEEGVGTIPVRARSK